MRHPCNGSAFLRVLIRSFFFHVITFILVGAHTRIWNLSSISGINWTDLLLSFVAGKFIVGALTWFAESFLRNRLLSWLEKGSKEKNLHGTSWFGRITQSEVGTRIFIDRLHGAVLWLVAGPVVGYGCTLIALHICGFNYS